MLKPSTIKYSGLRLYQMLPNLFRKVFYVPNFFGMVVASKDLKPALYFLKTHLKIRASSLQDICAIDFLSTSKKFVLIYQILSVFNNTRISVCVSINRAQSLLSVVSIFLGANWIEREIWDMFGIYFYGHKDLRRILTDYGFLGHPLRKDFAMVGYKEVWYSDKLGRVLYRPVKLSQEFKTFKFKPLWTRK